MQFFYGLALTRIERKASLYSKTYTACKQPAKWLRLFFVPKHLVILIIMYQTNTEHPAVTFTINPMRRTNLLSNVEVFMLLTLCTNFQVFAHFALQFSPMKLYF